MGKLDLFTRGLLILGFGGWESGSFLLQECSDLVELPFPGLGPLEYGLHCLFPWDLGSDLLWGLGRLTAVGWGIRAHRI